jgi:hypothetical protein
MPQISHPTFGTVGRADHSETSATEQAPRQATATEAAEEPTMTKNDLQSLIECGKVTDEIVIDGQRFRMSTLADNAQDAIVNKFSSPTTDASTFMELRRTVVASALETFNNRPLENLYRGDGNDELPVFDKKLAVVRLMQGQVVDKLYAFYEELLKRGGQRIDPEQIKN